VDEPEYRVLLGRRGVIALLQELSRKYIVRTRMARLGDHMEGEVIRTNVQLSGRPKKTVESPGDRGRKQTRQRAQFSQRSCVGYSLCCHPASATRGTGGNKLSVPHKDAPTLRYKQTSDRHSSQYISSESAFSRSQYPWLPQWHMYHRCRNLQR
jgi:hypothetical protein